MDPAEGQGADDPAERAADGGHTEHGHERDDRARGLPVDPVDGHRRQQRTEEEPDEETAEGEELDDGAQAEALDRRQHHHGQHDEVNDVHSLVPLWARTWSTK